MSYHVKWSKHDSEWHELTMNIRIKNDMNITGEQSRPEGGSRESAEGTVLTVVSTEHALHREKDFTV